MALLHRVAGNLALDLVNTIAWRGTDREIDHLATAGDILEWAREGGLVGPRFEIAAAEQPALVTRTLALRSAISEAGSAIAGGDPPPPDALKAIGAAAADALRTADLAGAPARFAFHGIDRIVGAVAWSALDLLRGDELSRLKQCPPAHCRWLFIDRTKNGSRRWCDMATCGNRAKKHTRRAAGGRRRAGG